MDALQRLLVPCEKNTLYDKNYIVITTATGFQQSYRLNVRKESAFLKSYARALSNPDLVFHFQVTLDSMMEHCLFFDVDYFSRKANIFEDARHLYLAVTGEMRRDMEWSAERGSNKYLDCAFLLSRTDSFQLVFPFAQISRLDYDILVRRMNSVLVTGGGGGRLDQEVQSLMLFGGTKGLKKPPLTIDGFFRHGDSFLHTDVSERERLRDELRYVTERERLRDGAAGEKEKATNCFRAMETYVNIFYPRESKFRRKRMCHVRYPLVVSLHWKADDSLLCGGGRLVAFYFDLNTQLTFLYSVLKSNLKDDLHYEKFESPFVLRWAKEYQNVFIFQTVCIQVWNCFNKFYPIKLPENLHRVDEIATLQHARHAENQRRYRERLKSDPYKREEYLHKARERWKRLKENGKVKSAKDLTEMQRFRQQKKWRESQQKHRNKNLKS